MVWSFKLSKRPALGVILAMALGVLSLANWTERGRFGVPEDGVVWADADAGVVASRVEPNSPAALVGARPGDRLLSINGEPLAEALDVARLLAGIGAWNRAEYLIERAGEPVRLSVVVGEISSRGTVGGVLMALGWAYGMIGLLAWLRCGSHPLAGRFFLFCLASLAVYSLSFTGQLDAFDRLVYWIDVWALLLMPALFLDFCARFPDGRLRHGGLQRAAYGLAVAMGSAHHAAAGGWAAGGIGDSALVEFFDAAPLVLLVANFLGGAAMVWDASRRSEDPVERLQLAALRFGALAAAVPFAVTYAIPFVLGVGPGPNQAFGIFALAALPVAIAAALFRYRLLDFEILRRQAIASGVTVALLLATGYLALFQGPLPATWLDRYAPVVWLCSLAVAAGLFRPVRDGLVSMFERRVYRDRYEDRKTLAAFAAELATETDLERMVAAAGARLTRTLQIERIAILAKTGSHETGAPSFRLVYRDGLDAVPAGESFDPSGLAAVQSPNGTPSALTEFAECRPDGSLARLGCRHFVPCRLRGETLAWIALGLTRDGNLLNGDDLSLAQALAGPFAIALENARLYAELQAKAEQYQRLKDYNENIVESLAVGILVLDAEGRVQSWNTSLELALHIDRDEAMGRTLGELLPPGLADEIERCQGETGSGNVYKYRLRDIDFPQEFRPDASGDPAERILNVAVAPLVAKDFRQIGRLVILDDVTERIELEDRVVQADKLGSVGLLAAGVAHEVNTPLAVISSYSQMLAAKFAQGSEEARLLGTMAEQTFVASEIVNSLLDFSRTADTQLAPCDISDPIEATLELAAPQLRAAGIGVESDLCDGAIVMGSKGKLQQVLLNLVFNARDAMPQGGTLRVVSRTAPDPGGTDHVEVLVSDTGIGMEPSVARRVFDPFYSTKAAGNGTGLGLAVSYGIVRDHAGSISVASEPGAGTTFTLAFPLAKQPVHA